MAKIIERIRFWHWKRRELARLEEDFKDVSDTWLKMCLASLRAPGELADKMVLQYAQKCNEIAAEIRRVKEMTA